MALYSVEQNAAALDHFIYLPVSQDMVSYLAYKASHVIRCEGQQSQSKALPPTPPSTPPQDSSEPLIPSLELFISTLVERSHVQVPTLMTSLVYLARLQQRLPPVAKGMKCTAHRIFLASLILAAKNLNDSSPKNKHWARYTAVRGYDHFGFSLTEVNLMEKQLLGLLDWDLNVTENDLYFHFEPFLAPIRTYQEQQRTQEKLRLLVLEQQRQLDLAIAEQQRRVIPCLYDISRSLANDHTRRPVYSSQPSQSSSRAPSRTPSRTPSLSPSLRSPSHASYSSTDSYNIASSPLSIASSYSEVLSDDIPVHIQRYDAPHLPSVMHIDSYKAAPPSYPPLDIIAPAAVVKKTKPSNIFSRFLPTMSRPQMLHQAHSY